jgi:tetratricopeptide (TPR) repeat protein
MAMTRSRLVAAATLVCAISLATPALAASVGWERVPLADALAKAGKSGKMVVVDVYADWCGPCKKYDSEVFVQDDVKALLDDAVTVKIDGEKGEGPAIVEKYHVVGYPTILFLSADGKEVDRIFGFRKTEAFKTEAGDLLTGRRNLAVMRRELAAAPGDHELRYKVGEKLAIKGDTDAAIAVFKPIFDDDPDNRAGYRPRVHYLLGKYAYLRGKKDYAKAVEQFQTLIDKYPESKEAGNAPYSLARAWFKSGDPGKARAALDAWIAQSPDDVGRYNSAAWFCFKNNFDLDRAAGLARTGLKKDPKASYLWDTLAEIEYARGDKKAARKAIKSAMKAAPGDPYYKKQLKKFKR